MVRLVDIAKAAGVSVSLVSRVLNDDPAARATEETRRRVRDTAAAMGYRPHHAARALKLARTNTIALAVPVLTNAIFSELLRGVEDEARELGYTLMFARSESFDEQRQMSQLVEEGRVDGFLLQRPDDETDESLARRIGNAPVVLINSVLPGHPGSVMIDDHGAAALATEHLLSLGHRRIGLVNGFQTTETARRRGAGFAQTLAAAGLDPELSPVTHFGYAPESAAAEHAVTEIFGDDRPKREQPTALVVANVNAALAVLTCLRRHGLGVPDDVSVVAIHDAWTAEHSWPPVTTVRLPVYEQGQTSVRMLHDALRGIAAGDTIIEEPPPILVERESVRPLRARRTAPR
ncbi:LacI family DNA-binding transcriptional regulator [Actinopolymorpha alba]|uniref:LacI family DNA-binding transcriptional regulator n=1 Tax=Actinopolymorpha alba TaxID=533267 RepID=UPI00039D8473|nr:LacI family DNA-binding transcriptional regulator [Actinopolymorpha alba]